MGNVRLSYLKNAVTGNLQVVEEENYYAFGMKHSGYNNAVTGLGNATAQKLGYNGVEFEEALGLGLYEMDYRQYDPAIGKFNSIDLLAEEAYSESPYHFGYNNPVYWADPTGLSGVSPLFETMWNLTPEGTNSKWYNKGDGFFAGNAGGKEIDIDSGSLVYYVYDIVQTLPNLDISISRGAGLRGFRYGLSTSFAEHLYFNGDAYADLRSRYRWGQVHDFLDIVGVADPTGIADGINAGLFAYQGDYVNASIRAIAIIPYVGDVVKGGNGIIKKAKVVEGIYEFTAASGKTYVGQSSNIAKRLEQHIASGKLLPGTAVATTEVLGGKTAREIAEQLRINSLGGIKNLENIRNPIGIKRQHLLNITP